MKLFGNTHGKSRRTRQSGGQPAAPRQQVEQDWLEEGAQPASNVAQRPRPQQPQQGRQPEAQPRPAQNPQSRQQGAQQPPRQQVQPRPAQSPRSQSSQGRQPQQGRGAQQAARPQYPQQPVQRAYSQEAGQQGPASGAGKKGKPLPYTKAAAKWAGYEGYEPYRTEEDKRQIEAMIAAYQKKKIIRRVILLVVLLALVAGGIIFWKSWVRPPDLNQDPVIQNTSQPSAPVASPGDADAEVSQAPTTGRRDGVYTFLVVGNDDGNGNTDTILVGTFDTVQEKLDIVSIPRDTLVNVSWEVKKINTVLAYTDVEGLKDALADIMGFRVDSYGVIDLEAFVALVNAVDGVDFDVPVDMHYSDPVQNLYIDISAGYQHLTGEQAVQVVRFRSGYANGDIGRIETQQAFLQALAAKCLSLDQLLSNASEYAEIFKTYVDTDLTLGNMIWYLQQFMKLDAEDIRFHVLPGDGLENVMGLSYVSIYPDEWLTMINEYLNPMYQNIQLSDLSIMTRNTNGDLYMTDGSEMYTNFYDNT